MRSSRPKQKIGRNGNLNQILHEKATDSVAIGEEVDWLLG